MSQDIDADFAELLDQDGMAEVDAILADASAGNTAADATVKVDPKSAPSIQEAQQPNVASNKPSIGKKRQLLVPQTSNKRAFLQVKTDNPTAGSASLLQKDPSPSPTAPLASPSTSMPAASAPASVASSPAKTVASEDASKAAGDDNMEVDADDGAPKEVAGSDEPEVQSPKKPAPAPTTNSSKAEAAKDKHNDAAAPASGVSSKALAAGKRKGLAVAKAGVDTDKPKAPKAPTAKPATASSSKAAAGAPSETAARKLPKAQTAFFFFSAEKRAELKESEPGLSMPEYAKRIGELWKELGDADKKPYTDKAIADKERVAAEIAAMDPSELAAIKKAEADARTAKKEKKTDKAAGKAGKAPEAADAQEVKGDDKGAAKEDKRAEKTAELEAKKAEKAAAKAEAAAKKQAVKAEKAEAGRKMKAAMKLFHQEHYSTFKADNPTMEAAEVTALICKAWEAMEQAEKDTYFKKADEAAEAAAAAKASKILTAKAGKGAGKRSKKTSDDEAGSDEETDTNHGSSRSRRASAADQDDDESDREDVDWEGNPAVDIISESAGAFQVARKGLMLTEYGEVDRRKAKERLLPGATAEELPVSTQQVQEYEASCQRFWAAVKSRMHKDHLDLEELEEGSPLEMCYLLGKLQEKDQLLDPKAKRPKGDLDMLRRLPVMRLSMLVQRMVDLERRQAKAAMQDAARCKEVLGGLLKAVEDSSDQVLCEGEAVAAAAAVLESA